MEELQDAIEDAQYVNAIAAVGDGPRPVLPWEIPTEEQLSEWKAEARSKAAEGSPEPFTMDWTLSHALGFFLFSAYLKESCKEYVQINFIEEVLRWKLTQGRHRAEKTSFIIENYLSSQTSSSASSAPAEPLDPPAEKSVDDPENGTANQQNTPKSAKLPDMSQIEEHDLMFTPNEMPPEELQELCSESLDPSCSKNCIGLKGPVLETIMDRVDKLKNAPDFESLRHIREGFENGSLAVDDDEEKVDIVHKEKKPCRDRSLRNLSVVANTLPSNLFDCAETVIVQNLRGKHWDGFQASEHNAKFLNFLWFQDRKVEEEDFFVMRVLGRGGFGLVTACKKGTSGKLYAMKVMNKKRIKIKKAEQLTLNEQLCLADVNSPFVVNLKYSFQSTTDVFLILDLMTGGDLSFHLSQQGRFSHKECHYYGARIMLGLQALHDRGYVYRDLKPENCLLGEDGRVKLTDLGLAVKVTPNLHGAAGTRGYWAPEMLRRDKNGKRLPYNHMVDWFGFGCCLAEFISGVNPFRSEAALNFGMEKNKKTKVSSLSTGKDKKEDKKAKEKAIDYATLEMHPVFESKRYSEIAADICRRLLDKNAHTRLGVNGAKEIMAHPWFREVNWEMITSDRERPPFIPAKDVNAASQSEIGTFAEDKTFHETVLDEKDQDVYKDWNFTNEKAFAAEVIEFLIYERETGEPLLPMNPVSSCCCVIV